MLHKPHTAKTPYYKKEEQKKALELKKIKKVIAGTLIKQINSYRIKYVYNMYENLLCLPYFQGMSKDDITAILDKVTFEFVKYADKETIYKAGDKCNRFCILTRGELQANTQSPDTTYRITENIPAPYAIEPHSLFGHDTTYKSSYTAKGECSILLIDKKFLFSEFIKHNIFTINFLNLISHNTQKLHEAIWSHTPGSIEGRIIRFIATRCNNLKGEKRVLIKMECLAAILCETRLNVSKALNNLQDSSLLELHRKEIVIPSMEKLIKEPLFTSEAADK